MATLENTVAIIFEGVDRMGSGVDSATKRIDKLSGAVDSAAKPLATVTKSLVAAEAAAVGMAVVFAGQAYNASVKFESAQKDLAKVLSEGDGSVDQFTDQIIRLSNTYGESSSELLQSMANFKQAGFDAAESAQLVKNSLDLMIAGDISAAESSEYLVATLKGFRSPASDAAEILETLNATSNTYATDVNELAKGMAGISPIAKAMGMDYQETAEALVPVIEVFRSGDEAATGLKTGLLKLLDDSKPVQEAMASIGVSQHDVNGEMRAGKDILADVAAGFGTLGESQKLAFASQLFGIDQSARMVTVMEAMAGGTIDVNKAMRESASVSDEVAIKLGSAQKAGDRLAATFENLQIALGAKYRDEVAGITNGISDIFVAFEQATRDGAMDGFFEEVSGHFEEIQRLAGEVAAALPEALANADYSGFSDGIAALLGDLDDVSITSDDLQGVIEGVGQAFKSLSEFTAGTAEVFAGLIAVIKPVVEGFTSMDAENQKMLGTLGGAAIVVGPVVAVIGTLTTAISALAGKGGVIAAALPAVRALIGVLSGPVGLAVAATSFAVPALIKLNSNVEDFVTDADKAAQAAREFGSALDGAISQEAIESAILVATQYGYFGEAAETATGVIGHSSEGISQSINKAVASAREMEDATRTLVSEDGIAAAKALTRASNDLGDSAEGSAKLISDVAIESAKAASGYSTISETAIAAAKALNTTREATDKTGKALNEATKESDDFRLKWEEIASNERMKTLELGVDLKVAQMESDTRRIEASFESLTGTISTAGETISSLWGTLAGGDLSFRQQWSLEDQLDEENRIRQEAFDLQKRLTESQIRQMDAKTKALKEGDGLIKIDSTGLEPALETVMWQIIEKVQIQANADGAEFLVGI